MTPTVSKLDLSAWAARDPQAIARELTRHGALLFRGFALNSSQGFARLAAVVCEDLMRENGEHQRSRLADGVYTPVAYSPGNKLLWHNENSFNHTWPRKILFAALEPAVSGGETPLVDSRRVLQSLRPALRRRFEQLGVLYQRNYYRGAGLDWQTAFQTESRVAVEQRCRRERMSFEWFPDGRLRTRAQRPAVLRHPMTGEASWFNQAQHWHPSCLDPDTRASLESLFSPDALPRHCFFGDGSPIEDEHMNEILDVYQSLEVSFSWQRGDVLLLDNILVAHARNAYVGPRALLVAMGDLGHYPSAPPDPLTIPSEGLV